MFTGSLTTRSVKIIIMSWYGNSSCMMARTLTRVVRSEPKIVCNVLNKQLALHHCTWKWTARNYGTDAGPWDAVGRQRQVLRRAYGVDLHMRILAKAARCQGAHPRSSASFSVFGAVSGRAMYSWFISTNSWHIMPLCCQYRIYIYIYRLISTYIYIW